MSDQEKHEWDRLPRETSRGFELFCAYRDMGIERSLRKLKQGTAGAPNVNRLKRLSTRWNWVERCRAYDDYLEHQDRLNQEKERREMHKRHAKIAVLGQNIAVKGLEKLLTRVQGEDQAVAPSDLTRLLDTSVKVERLSRGEPTESHAVSGPSGGPVEFANMSDNERRAEMIRCLKEMGKTNEEALALAAQLMGDAKRA